MLRKSNGRCGDENLVMRHRYPQPGNEDEFEDFCVRFYRQLLKRGGLVRYAKRGESQDGIDIIDQLGLKPLLVIQCKNHEQTKTIPPQEIKDEVSLAEASCHRIDHYIIATTAKKSKKAQDTVLKLNQRPDNSRPFTVEIHFWEEICTHLCEFGHAVAEFIRWGERSPEEPLEPVRFVSDNFASARLEEGTEGSELYPEIIALFDERKLEAAEHEIGKLPEPEQDTTLTTKQRYAILRLRAKLALERLRFDEAVRLFNLAYETCPELQQARQNRVLALEFAGERTQAFTEAEKLLADGIRSPNLVTLLIRNSSDPADLASHQGIIDEYISSEEDVNLALAHKYLSWDQIEPAEAAARKAVDIAPDSAHALFSCGMVAHHAGLQGDWQNRYEHLAKAIRCYSDALNAAERDKYIGLIPEIRTNRGRVHAFLGNLDEAGEDYRTAVRVSDKPSLYAEDAVSFFLHEQDYDSAWEFLPVLDAKSDEAVFLIGATEYHQAPDDEKKQHIADFEKLASREFDRATEVRFHCVQWAIALQDFALARQCVPDDFVARQPFQGNTLLAWILLESNDEEQARALVSVALESSSRSARQQEIAVLARLLVRIGDDESALPLCEQAATPGVLDDDCKRLVECAQRLERHDTLLRVCAELRKTDQQDNLIRKMEVQLLSNYLPEEAFALAKQFRQFDESYFSAASNFLAVRLGKKDEIEFDDTALPNPDDFEPDEAYLVVTPYIEVKRYRDALGFAYHQLRGHFAEVRAHGQYIWLVLQYGQKSEIQHLRDVVDEQSAIRLENLTTGEQRWVIVENRHPDPARNEFAPSTSVAQALNGKRAGDVVDVRGPSVQMQQERVVEIQSKYIRLFQDAMSNFQNRFPGAGAIQSIHVGGEDDFDPTPIIESLKDRREHIDQVMAIYRDNLCSLHFLASQLGINERQLMIGLTAHNDRFVRCVECSPQEFGETVAAGFTKKKFVLDLSAIVTISRLDAWDHLDRGLEYLVSRVASDTLAEWLHELTDQEGKPAGYASLSDDGRMSFQDVTAEQLEQERDEVHRMVSNVHALCTVKDSITLAELDPARREQYVKICGLHSLQSMSIAKDEGALLWTDDYLVAVVGQMDFGFKWIWTQLAFKTLENEKQLDADTYSRLTARLAAWNYIATVWNPRDLIAAGNLCDWDAKVWPLKQCIRLIGTCALPLAGKARLAIEFFRLLRRSSCIELKQTPIVQAALDAIGNARAVQWILSRLDHFFGVDYRSAEFLKFELSYWLRLR